MPIAASLPSSPALSRLLRQLLRAQGRCVLASIKANRVPSLAPFRPAMVEALTPLFVRHVQQGIRGLAVMVNRGVHLDGKKAASSAASRLPARKPPIKRPRIRVTAARLQAAVDAAVLDLCDETLATSEMRAKKALWLLREELGAGLAQRECLRRLTARLRAIFDDPMRARRIAATEASRARNLGKKLAAEASGRVTGFIWRSFPNCCEACRKLDGKRRKLGVPFVVLPGNGPYSVVEFAPLHPGCYCKMEVY
jgi:hypothetical protein